MPRSRRCSSQAAAAQNPAYPRRAAGDRTHRRLRAFALEAGETGFRDAQAAWGVRGLRSIATNYCGSDAQLATTTTPRSPIRRVRRPIRRASLTHRNYTANVEQSLSRIDIPPPYRTLIILPLDHCFAHVVGFYIMIACGATVATVQIGATPMETLKNIPLNIREVRPHFLLSVPALAKNFRKNIESSDPRQRCVYRTAVPVGAAYGLCL